MKKIIFITMMFLISGTYVQAEDKIVNIPLIASNCNDRVPKVTEIKGQLKIPDGLMQSTSAVIIFHSNAGKVGVGSAYAQELNSAGFVTLEVDSYGPRDINNGNNSFAPTACDRLNDAWSSLYFLSTIPQVNINKVGFIGLSSGGLVGLALAKGMLPRKFDKSDERHLAITKMRFKKFFILYPGCANFLYDENLNWIRNPNMPRRKVMTSGDMRLAVGTNDDYEIDAKSDCAKIIEEFKQYRINGSLILLDGATHAFDWQNPPPPSISRFAKAGQGSMVSMNYSEKDTRDIKVNVINFFSELNKQ